MKFNFRIIAVLSLTTVIMGSSACKKSDDNSNKTQPIDSSRIPILSRNNIDSVIGTYYGWTISHENRYSGGVHQEFNKYIGLDTLLLLKANDTVLKLSYKHIIGGSTYVFDSTDLMFSSLAMLTLVPSQDSLYYQFSFSSGDTQEGDFVFCHFAGRK